MTKRTRTLWGSLCAAAMISLVPMTGAQADGYWQCVPFARLMSGIQIFGDARTWWSQAVGHRAGHRHEADHGGGGQGTPEGSRPFRHAVGTPPRHWAKG